MSIIVFIIILAVLVFAHELGHFLAAKSADVRVDEFSIGFPPRVVSKKIGETVYALNIVPLGGYVKIFGEDGDTADQSVEISNIDSTERNFHQKNRGVQAFILSAGIIANFVFAWFLISLGLVIGLPTPLDSATGPNISNAHVVVAEISPGSPASRADFEAGDTIASLQSGSDKILNPGIDDVSAFVVKHSNQEIEATLIRGQATIQTAVTPVKGIIKNVPAIGISMIIIGTVKYPFAQSLLQGALDTGSFTVAIVKALAQFFYNVVLFKADLSQVSGPVGIASMVGEAEKLGISYLLTFTAVISINLAIINLIPFPALDGGRLLFVAIEAIIRRPINPRIQRIANGVGLALLLILMVLVTLSDVLKLIAK